MEKILSEFGVQPVLLAAQVVNFLILLFILKRFLYKPILKVLETRKQKIADSLKQAEEIETRLTKLAEEEEKRLQKASLEAEKIINEGNTAKAALLEEAKLQAEGVARKVTEEAKKQIESEREKLRQEIRIEVAGLVAEGLRVVAGKTLSEKDKKDLVNKSIRGLS